MLASFTGRAFQDGLDRLSDDEPVGVGLAARRNQAQQAAVEPTVVSELEDWSKQTLVETTCSTR
jgi:hypothetical protein